MNGTPADNILVPLDKESYSEELKEKQENTSYSSYHLSLEHQLHSYLPQISCILTFESDILTICYLLSQNKRILFLILITDILLPNANGSLSLHLLQLMYRHTFAILTAP